MIVITSRFGQLGNRLLIFAKFITLARAENLTLMNLGFGGYACYFRTLSRDRLCRYPPSGQAGALAAGLARQYYRRLAQLGRNVVVLNAGLSKELNLADPEFVRLAREKTVVFAGGWPRLDADYKAEHAPAVREFFRPAADHQRNIEAVVNRAHATCEVLVGLHVRQGDYRTWEDGRYYYSSAQYVELMPRLAALYPGRAVGFLVVSDEKQDPAAYASQPVSFGSGHILEDMYSLAACDAIVGPPSTFAGWASFYGRVPRLQIKDIAAPVRLDAFMEPAA
ncbi:MAG: hypothetical protein HYZ26_13255 [Chloroflexi bacterium]|nr:hypothetical protein [Chloroflexota bacterium]